MPVPHNALNPTNPSHPEEVGFCDRCCRFRYLKDLIWQWEWAGQTLVNLRLLVCADSCYDLPNEQNRTIILGPDPNPIKDPRPGFFQTQENAVGVPPIPPYVIDDDT